jgi:hypothetical protein
MFDLVRTDHKSTSCDATAQREPRRVEKRGWSR